MKAFFCVFLVSFLGVSSVLAQPDAGAMVTRTYSFPLPRWSRFTALTGTIHKEGFGGPVQSQDLPWARKTATPEDTKRFFERTFGLTFPEGSWIHATQQSGSLLVVMHNTELNHERFRLVLLQTGSLGINVKIHARWLAFTPDEIDGPEREKGGELSDDEILNLWRNGAGETLATQSLVTRNGVNSILELGDEMIYPTSMSVPTNAVDKVVYGSFTTRKEGAVLNVTPSVSPDFESVRLVVLPELTELRGWMPTIPEEVRPMTPVFRAVDFTGSVKLMNGKLRLVGRSSTPPRDNPRIIMLFMSARLLNPDGSEFEPPDIDLLRRPDAP